MEGVKPGNAPRRSQSHTTAFPESSIAPTPHVQGVPESEEGIHMDETYANARDHFFAAIRSLAASPDSIQTRLIEASQSILQVTISEFEENHELKIRFARILDLLAVDQDDLETTAVETAADMTDFEAVKVADLICDFFTDLE
jgi:hypothetical protein